MRRNHLVHLVIVLAAVSLLPAAPGWSAGRRAKMDHFLTRLARGHGVGIDRSGKATGKIGKEELKHYARFLAINPDADPPTAQIRMRLDRSARGRLEAIGIKTYGARPEFASAMVPITRLQEIAAIPGIEMMQLLRIPQPELDVSVPEIRSDQAATAYHAHGAGVVVGVVDTGTDVTHGDFQNPDGTTRFKMVWNQDDRCTGTPPPAPFDFGCLFTETDINAALGGTGSIDFADSDGHGTHVMGSAAGDGSDNGNGALPPFTFVGPAPEAALITVKTFPEPGLPGSCSTCFQIGLGLEFIDAMADSLGMPYAVNLSLGSSFGGHDGSDIDEITIDTLTGPGIPGKVVAKSAGNNRGFGIHASGTVATGETDTHTFTIPSYTAAPGVFNDVQAWSMWYAGGDSMTVTISDPATMGAQGCPGDQTLTASTGDGFQGVSTSSGVILIDDTGSPAINGARFFEMELDDQLGQAPCQGTWTVQITGDAITAGGRYDMWIWFSSFGTQGLFSDWNAPDFSQLISVPGTSFHVTTVGAYKTKQTWTNVDGVGYQWNDTAPFGEIAAFSSPGPSRDGRLKPEIMAPGFGVMSALSADVPASRVGPAGLERALVGEDGAHWILAGTSFSSPHIAGVYAQMLGLNPNLDAVQLRNLLTSTARTDGFTGATPNDDWGYGKADVLAAFDLIVKLIPDLMMSGSSGAWTGIATADTYNVYRADVQALDGTFFGTCLSPGLPTPTFVDPDLPVPGQAFAYYVTGVKDGIEGLIRVESDGTGVPPSNPCP